MKLGFQTERITETIELDPMDEFTLVQIRIWFCEVKKAEHLIA